MLAVKSFILLFGISICEAARLLVILGDTYHEAPLDDPSSILEHLDPNRQTLIYISGVDGNLTSTSVTTVLDAYTPFNRVYLDWSKEAKALLDLVPLSYLFYNVPNAEQIGCRLGLAIVTLIKNGLKITDFFLMGHSLGAHVAGLAGKCAKDKGYTLERIIGLDPAGPGYTKVIPIFPGLDADSANCVIIIHTDPDGLGGAKPIGHIDYYPNYNKTYTMQPGCTEKANPLKFTPNNTCSHDLAWRLACVVVKVPGILIGQYAVSGDAWLAGLGDPSNTATITLYCTPGASGTYYLRTVETYPYGLGLAGSYP